MPTVPEVENDVPQPVMQQGRRKVVSGTIHRAPKVERKPVDEVTWAEAFASRAYSVEELKQIGNREAMQAGIRVIFERQRAGSQEWTGAVMRLGAPFEHKQ